MTTNLPAPIPVRALLFDFDGTLTDPGALDFRIIRSRLNCPEDIPVLEFIESLPDPQRRSAARRALAEFERRAAALSRPNPHAEQVVAQARKLGLKVGILTRNTLECVKIALDNFENLTLEDFHLVLTRDDKVAPKPAPDGILAAASFWGLPPEQIMVIGDFIFDIEAGRRAGCLTVWLDAGTVPADMRRQLDYDYRITGLDRLIPVIERHLPLDTGKLPAPLLEELLDKFQVEDPSIVVPPGPGQDTAAVRPEKDRLLVLKSDPITFATEQLGMYTVAVNANDIATAGAVPRWMLATLLLPAGTTGGQVREIFASLHGACKQAGITLCGGHTEITDAVTRPVVSAAMVGSVPEKDLIAKENMAAGDSVLMTKKAAVEGTAIIARQFARELESKGVDRAVIDEARNYLQRISILPEARLAAASGQVTAMHDVTEGGVATAVSELAAAGGCRLRIDLERIPVYPATAIFCRALGLDPLGLIGSGSLLLTCRGQYRRRLMDELAKAGIEVAEIGTVAGKGRGIDARRNGRPVTWPEFQVDEITRLFR